MVSSYPHHKLNSWGDLGLVLGGRKAYHGGTWATLGNYDGTAPLILLGILISIDLNYISGQATNNQTK